MTAKGIAQTQSWHRRGHYVDCWQYHERCALLSARDLMETRAAHVKAQARNLRTAIERLDQVGSLPADDLLVDAARKILAEFHAALRKRQDQ